MAAPPLADSIKLHLSRQHLEATTQLPQDWKPRRHIAIYFVPGNPGLIEYYRPFLTHLQSALTPTAITTGTTFTIAGSNLAGFHLNEPRFFAHDKSTQLPLNLQQQIEDVEYNVLGAAITAPHHAHYVDDDEVPVEVILIGHSVGAYILMSLIERSVRFKGSPAYDLSSPRKYIAGICLFPTVVDLYASPNGRKAAWMAHLPGFSRVLQALAKMLCWTVSFATLVSLVRRITGQPEPAARVTASFLASPMGVRQAIYLAQHELLEMRQDRWSDEVWGDGSSSSSSSTSPENAEDMPKPGIPEVSDSSKENLEPSNPTSQTTPITTEEADNPALFFFWGADDHWIANTTRDAVIASRAAIPPSTESLINSSSSSTPRSGPKMEIDQDGLPHDFCTRDEYSAMVADKVAGYVREVVESGRNVR